MKFIAAVLLLVVVAADAQRFTSRFSSEELGGNFPDSVEDRARYDFSWQVSDEDTHFDNREQRHGDNTRGSYSVQLPDGRIQTVTYFVDGNSGYVAQVSYSSNEVESAESFEQFNGNRRIFRL